MSNYHISEEALHLLSSTANTRALFEAMEQPGIEMSLEEFLSEKWMVDGTI